MAIIYDQLSDRFDHHDHRRTLTYVKCQVSNAYTAPWDMLNNFCFREYDQK